MYIRAAVNELSNESNDFRRNEACNPEASPATLALLAKDSRYEAGDDDEEEEDEH